MEIQQVALNGKRVGPECRTKSHVGHSVETLAVHSNPGDVHTVGRHQLVISREIDGRDGVLCAVASPSPWSRQDAERPSQQCACAPHTSLGDQAANLAARYMMSS